MTDLLRKSEALAKEEGFRLIRKIGVSGTKHKYEARLDGKRGKWLVTLWADVDQFCAGPGRNKRDE